MDKFDIFYNGIDPLTRLFFVGTLAYISIIFLMRIFGSRSLSTMNAFDFIITVTLGSVFGRVLTAKGGGSFRSCFRFPATPGTSTHFSSLETRSKVFKNLVTSQPMLLFYDGKFKRKIMQKSRLNQEDLMGAARKKGFVSLDQVKAIILETDRTFSVLEKSDQNKNPTYENLL